MSAITQFISELPHWPSLMGWAWVAITLLAYLMVMGIRRLIKNKAWNAPLILTSLLMAVILILSDISYEEYMDGGAVWGWFLMPATIAMSIPLYDHIDILRQTLKPILVGIISGSVVAVVSALLVAVFMGVSPQTFVSLAPKSVTTPIAIGVGYEIGGLSGLIAAIVVVTGVFGILVAPTLFRLIGVTDVKAQGLAYGLAAHAIGTSEALRINPLMGSFAALALGVNGLLTGLFLPALMLWLGFAL